MGCVRQKKQKEATSWMRRCGKKKKKCVWGERGEGRSRAGYLIAGALRGDAFRRDVVCINKEEMVRTRERGSHLHVGLVLFGEMHTRARKRGGDGHGLHSPLRRGH